MGFFELVLAITLGVLLATMLRDALPGLLVIALVALGIAALLSVVVAVVVLGLAAPDFTWRLLLGILLVVAAIIILRDLIQADWRATSQRLRSRCTRLVRSHYFQALVLYSIAVATLLSVLRETARISIEQTFVWASASIVAFPVVVIFLDVRRGMWRRK